MQHPDATTLLELIRRALAAMRLPDVVVGLADTGGDADADHFTFLVGDKEVDVDRDLVEADEAHARAAITALLEQALRE